MSACGDLVLGFDFGTSSVKAALYDRVGQVVAENQRDYPLLLPAPGWAEQRPEDWWAAMGAVTQTLLAKSNIAPDRIDAMAISAQMCGTVPVDRDGKPLHSCLIWLDTRSQPIARRITAGGPRVAGYGAFTLARWLWLTNGAPNLSGKDPTTKILWLREERPDVWAQTHKVLDVKDWLLHRCTGEFVTTEDCAHLTWLMDTRPGRRNWSSALLGRTGIPREVLPDIVKATASVGGLTGEAARHLGLAEGTPVAAGAGDINACALAAGSLAPGSYHMHLGTSMWLGAHSERRRVSPTTAVATICAAVPDRYFLVATQESAGSAIAWACNALGFANGDETGIDAFCSAAAGVEPAHGNPIFMPWLFGERVPVDNKFLRGGFVNLSLNHGRAELAAAVLEGIGLNTRWAMQGAERLVAPTDPTIRVMGGAVTNDHLCQMLADTLQRPMQRMESADLGGALGAAMIAAVAAGWFGSLDEATGMARPERLFEPDRARADFYRDRFDRFVALYRATRGWYRHLLR